MECYHAEAKNGMQAGNVVVISDGKGMTETASWELNSFVVFIQKRQEVNTSISHYHNLKTKQNIYQDKKVSEKTQVSND